MFPSARKPAQSRRTTPTAIMMPTRIRLLMFRKPVAVTSFTILFSAMVKTLSVRFIFDWGYSAPRLPIAPPHPGPKGAMLVGKGKPQINKKSLSLD